MGQTSNTLPPCCSPVCLHSQAALRPSTLNCSVWTYLVPGLVQVVFLTALVPSSSPKTKQERSSRCPAATGGESHGPWNRGLGDAAMTCGGCNVMVCLVRTPSEMRHDSRWPAGFWKPSSSARLHQEREILYYPLFWTMPRKPPPPRCRGLGGNETRTGTAGDFTELHNDEFLRVVSMQTVFRVYRKVNISIRWSPISSGPWRLWPNVSPEHSSQTKYMPLLKYWTVWPN